MVSCVQNTAIDIYHLQSDNPPSPSDVAYSHYISTVYMLTFFKTGSDSSSADILE